MKFNIELCLFVLLISVVFSAEHKNDDDNEDDTFVPTQEWQVIKKGQKIPKGLHIRINLETGVKEAKLIDRSESEKKSALSVLHDEKAANLNKETHSKLKFSEVEKAIKNVEAYEDELKSVDKVKTEFRSYEELKRDLDEVNLQPKTDAEIIKELLQKHENLRKRTLGEDETLAILSILEDLEYLVHQYDNANEFVLLNGFKDVVYKNLNSTSKEIKQETLKLMGASIQNNPKVKIYVLETGGLDALLRLLALESDLSVKARSFFALGGLLRGFPFAQLKFIENAGLSVFSKLFETNDIKIHIKIVTLIGDLLQEEWDSRQDYTTRNYKAKIKQYNDINLKYHLVENNYCENLNSLIINSVSIDINDHGTIEKCLNALQMVADECVPRLMPKTKEVLVNLRNIYKRIVAESDRSMSEDDIKIFIDLLNLCNYFVKTFEPNVKVEL